MTLRGMLILPGRPAQKERISDMKDVITAPDTQDWNGTEFRVGLSGAETGGTLSITDMVCQPGFGPPRHIHHDADEIFFLMTGEMQFYLDGQTLTRGPGDMVFVPRGAEHAFVVLGDVPCRHLAIFTPAGMEDFFCEMARLGLRIPQDIPQMTKIAEIYKMSFTGPPLVAGIQA